MASSSKSKQAKREFNPVSLSFLDVMSCGFGAVVLIFLILDHSTTTQQISSLTPDLQAEVSLLQEEILTGEEGLLQIRNTISDVDLQIVEAQGRALRIEEEINDFLDELAQLENAANTSEADIQSIQDQIAALELQLETMRDAGEQSTGNNIRQFVGDGNRQYLTGLLMGGNRVLILVDTSASMMDDTIVNIIRRRNMSEEAQRNSEKWVRVRNTVDWLTTQLPPPSRYQIYAFNNEVQALTANTEGTWLEVADEEQLSTAVETLHNIVPSEGTNLENLFISIQGLNPLPDNIYLITDGLPTLGNRNSNRRTVSGKDREQLFERALGELPPGIPVNIIMAPLEGDPMAAAYYWQLAIATRGSYLNPSEDWP